MPKPEPVDYSLSATNIAEGKIEDEFTCPICFNIVKDPEECNACDKIFCQGCILNWRQSSSTCPACNEHYEGRPFNRVLKNQLNTYSFKCVECGEVFKYDHAEIHMRIHAAVKPIDCPLGCGESCKEGKPSVSLHLSEQCPRMEVVCQSCNAQTVRAAINEHDCVLYLKSQLQERTARYYEQKE